MDKHNFAKLVLRGMAAGSLIIGSQLMAADDNEETTRYTFLASAGCKGQGGCGGGNGTGQPPQGYRQYTADNDAGYSQGSSYQGSSTSPSGSYYNTGTSTTTNPYQGSSSQSPSSSYYNSGSQGSNSNQGMQGGQFNSNPSTNNPSYPEAQRNVQGGRYLAADDIQGQQESLLASEDDEQNSDLAHHDEESDHSRLETLLADDGESEEPSLV